MEVFTISILTFVLGIMIGIGYRDDNPKKD